MDNGNEAQTPSKTPDLVLCLSGGGFRATFYHLGVIKLLRDYRLLKRVARILSVSGGSIMAAHLALNWDEYSCDFEEGGYYRAARQLVEFGRSDLRGRIVRRRIVLGWLGDRFRRSRQLEKHYANLLHGAELKSLPSAGPQFSFFVWRKQIVRKPWKLRTFRVFRIITCCFPKGSAT